MILLKITFIEPNRNAVSIDDFYYRGYQDQLKNPQGTGVRALVKQMISDKKILCRNIFLSDNGNKLEVLTVFADENALNEFLNHELVLYSNQLWQNRSWHKTREIFNLDDYKLLS